jgi:REP element-mobilizing transposase RayT
MNTFRNKTPRALSFYEAERQCEFTFLNNGPYYHLCTPGGQTEILFEDDEDFRFAMNLFAFCTWQSEGVTILTFEIMKNHLHVVMAGEREHIFAWFSLFKRRLQRYFMDKGLVKDLSGFDASLFPIDNLETLRNTIAYVNRNGYLVDARYTPFSYPWGANRFFYNPDIPFLQGTRYGNLSFREKRQLFRSHTIDYPNEKLVLNGYVLPSSFCNLALAERMFQSARSYFFLISRNVEVYRSIASQLGDLIFYTDDELFLIVRQLCKDAYGHSRPASLSKEAKLEMAKKMHFEYQAGNKQIQRMLRLEECDIIELFGR